VDSRIQVSLEEDGGDSTEQSGMMEEWSVAWPIFHRKRQVSVKVNLMLYKKTPTNQQDFTCCEVYILIYLFIINTVHAV